MKSYDLSHAPGIQIPLDKQPNVEQHEAVGGWVETSTELGGMVMV